MHPNAPQNPTGKFNGDGSVSISFDPVEGAKSYVIHYANANESDPHKAKMMGYSETNSWTLAAENVPSLVEGDKFYLYVQTFNELGEGSNEIEKAEFLNENKLGSAWSEPIILTKGGSN
ncbi:fibronectin type III domain-containing protein [Enterococcus faecium]|uniref:fibronectin type III domain-containing protein n=1 Tax=Enterococcus faecium TaxID=1352 RepID=UPI0015C5183C|nr:fibronectin type III domain-containing protein [Enterococcus faecium]